MDETKHFYSLDLFRGFCGYGVAFCHLQAFIYKNLHMEYLSLLFVGRFLPRKHLAKNTLLILINLQNLMLQKVPQIHIII